MDRIPGSLHLSPFRSVGNGPCFYTSPTHQEALARLHFLVRQDRSLGILTGDDGTGKSLMLARFVDQVRHTGQPACSVNLLGLEPLEFVWELAAGLRARPRAGDDLVTLWRKVSDRLRENLLLKLTTAIVLDDADEAAHEVLILVLRLLKSHPLGTTVILAAGPARLTRLGGELLQLSQLRIHLEAWEDGDVREFLQMALRRAGADPEFFDDSAIARLHELSGGLPRWVTHLAELTWLAAAGHNREAIDSDMVDRAFQELSAPCCAAPAGRM